MVQDKESEKKYNFILQSSLSNASKTKLLDGYKVFATSRVLPPPKDLKGELLDSTVCIFKIFTHNFSTLSLTRKVDFRIFEWRRNGYPKSGFSGTRSTRVEMG